MSKIITTKRYRVKCKLAFYVDAENEEDAQVQYLERLSSLDFQLEDMIEVGSKGKINEYGMRDEYAITQELLSIEELESGK